ncbi:hypothetical protein C0Q70_21075 [Pomacea canaliculata]|uniref:Uncharacterized protein n=1 Tax=Pomacea canaliculata TaxID=400727 RepID=A0A2T7NBH2_POMCA|nr:hypothetical protein C0Q70_21075 [Pomacea canaliculata]
MEGFRNEVTDTPTELLRRPSESALPTTGRRDSCLLFMSSLAKQDNTKVHYLERESESVSFRKVRGRLCSKAKF